MTGLLRKRWHASSSVLRAVSLSVPSSSISRYLPTWTALMPWWPICSRATWTVLPCGSTTAFFGVMMIFAFMLVPGNFAKKGRAGRANFGYRTNFEARMTRSVEFGGHLRHGGRVNDSILKDDAPHVME